jgi:hypothetical protein
MYRWLREIHMAAGLAFAPFALMYGVSAVRMSHMSWFSGTPTVSEVRAAVPPEEATDARVVARELIARGLLKGELTGIRATAEEYRFEVHRPGASSEVTYSRRSGEARIQHRDEGAMAALVRIHHLASVHYGYWVYNAWGVMLVLTAVALLIAAGTGVWMWTRIPRERAVGSALLLGTLGFTLALLAIIRLGS